MSRAFGLVLAFALTVTAFKSQPRESTTIVWEAENCAEIEAPMRIVRADEKASGSGYLQLPLGAGQGWRGMGGGHAVYRVEVPKDGIYRLWARTLWQDGCTNAFYLKAGNGPQVILGNDPVFGAWHWVRGQNFALTRGINYLRLDNHSDGTSLDKLVLTNQPSYAPAGLGDEISRFYDGFAGCDGDNTGSWEIKTGRWHVVPSVGEAASGVNDSLALWGNEGGEIIAGFPEWHDYDLSVTCMPTGPGNICLIAFMDATGRHIRVKWQLVESDSRIEILEVGTSDTLLANSAALPWIADRWYTLGLRLDGNQISVALDGNSVAHATTTLSTRGQVGLSSSGMMAAYFDNVDVAFHGKEQSDATT